MYSGGGGRGIAPSDSNFLITDEIDLLEVKESITNLRSIAVL
mgnify:CR=1 FL=1